VVRDRPGDGRERNLELGTSWFQNRDEWLAMPADDGPDKWQRVSVQVDLSRREGVPGEPGRRVDIVTPVEAIQPVAVPPVTVSNVDIQQQSMSFDVDQIGVPVLVRVGYFPNWNASGADGPYRVGPNMMVVIPEANHVELSYGRSLVDWFTILLTLAGIGLCVLWRFKGDVHHFAETPVSFTGATGASGTDPHGTADAAIDEEPGDTFGESSEGDFDMSADQADQADQQDLAALVESADWTDLDADSERSEHDPDLSGDDGWEPPLSPR
jgi:hypothetical protein